jgi:AcrR family transcriptional regulator
MTKFHKETFEKTSEDRRQKILDVALTEFAQNGYSAAKINDIARKSGISIGSLYSYFESKEDLFLTIVSMTTRLLESALAESTKDGGDVFTVFERVLRLIEARADEFYKYNQVYQSITTQELSFLSQKLSSQIEKVVVKLFVDLIDEGKKSGVVNQQVDSNVSALLLDSIAMMYQFSHSSDYYKERLKLFLGDSYANPDFDTCERILKFVKRAMA